MINRGLNTVSVCSSPKSPQLSYSKCGAKRLLTVQQVMNNTLTYNTGTNMTLISQGREQTDDTKSKNKPKTGRSNGGVNGR